MNSFEMRKNKMAPYKLKGVHVVRKTNGCSMFSVYRPCLSHLLSSFRHVTCTEIRLFDILSNTSKESQYLCHKLGTTIRRRSAGTSTIKLVAQKLCIASHWHVILNKTHIVEGCSHRKPMKRLISFLLGYVLSTRPWLIGKPVTGGLARCSK